MLKSVPWWTKECASRIKNRNKAKNKLVKCWSEENLNYYKKKKKKKRGTEDNMPSKKQLLAILLFQNKQIHTCWSEENLKYKKKKKNEAQRTIFQARNNYWQSFCSKINRSTPASMMWNFIKNSNGIPTHKNQSMPTLYAGDNRFVSDKNKAN